MRQPFHTRHPLPPLPWLQGGMLTSDIKWNFTKVR